MSDSLVGLPFAMAPVALIEAPISSQAVRVFLAIHSHSSASGPSPFPSHQRLADMCRVSKNTVRRCISELCASGFLEVHPRKRENGSQASNEYVLRVPGGVLTDE